MCETVTQHASSSDINTNYLHINFYSEHMDAFFCRG